ncbi:uncharacterized protein Dana_GF11079 [Drosophila ananassae]|uniref:DUF4739 domain-containing protein n=2 Tax=Drosophila ananassae TaxID=7217 RepID=B3MIL5_DROAN|nr:uncharacterized protein Dana_GF11079 [Drosophila ananassae]
MELDPPMSSGLMSCVRENSPPLEPELDVTDGGAGIGAGGPMSLPPEGGRSHGGAVTSTPISSPVNDGHEPTTAEQQQQQHQQQQQQQKRRRFHPLRNLRRIFRRRTINSSADSPANSICQSPGQGTGIGPGPGSCNTLPPPTSSSSEKNLRNVLASPPGSPRNKSHPLPEGSYQTQSLPKSKSYGSHRDELLSVLLGKKRATKQAQQQHSLDSQVQQQSHSQPSQSQSQQEAMFQAQQRQPRGVAIFPDVIGLSRSSYFPTGEHYQQRHLRSVGDSSQELICAEREGVTGSGGSGAGSGAVDISDSQRSLSEGRLLDVDGDYSRDQLSQSHDSVFSESATASSLSIILKAELTDVLRKRRNRPDASDEDLGLPRSPASPQRRAAGGNSSRNNSGVSHHQTSSVSMLSVNSNEAETEDSQSSMHQRHHSRVSTSSSISVSSDILRSHNEDDVDAVGGERHRLSHAAAKHKMAIRPAKKKGPTRQHRMTLETSIPEANEDVLKMSPGLRGVHETELKTKTRSLPPKSLTAISIPPGNALTTTKRTKTIEQTQTTVTSSSSSSTTSQVFGRRTMKTTNTLLENRGESSTDGDDILERDATESGFLRRLIHRNSKRSIARANDGLEDTDSSQSVAKKLQISTSCLEAAAREPLSMPDKSRSATSHEQHIQETRQTIKREIHNEGKHGLNAMVSNYGVHPQPPTALKPKSGPAARQRYVPQELGAGTLVQEKMSPGNDVTNLLSKSSRGNDTFQSTTLVREQQTKVETHSSGHFESRKPRIVGLSAFQQKLSRSTDSVGQHSSSSNSLETSTDEPSPLYYEEKQRKTVEKSRSFRNYQEDGVDSQGSGSGVVHNNMPSLPDLSLSFRVPSTYYKQSPQSPCSPMSPNAKCVSLGFEINDNKLLQARAESTGQLVTPKSPGAAKLLVGSGASGPTNISQIEQNIDMIVKSPLVSVLRKSTVITTTEKEPSPPPKQRPRVLDLGVAKVAAAAPGPSPSPASPLTKSAKLSNSPPTTPAKSQGTSSGHNSRRNSSNVEATGEPEFMKIQLNRVDQARLHQKTNHLVLAKNLKSPEDRSQSSDDLSFRRNSGEGLTGIEIVEKPLSSVVPVPNLGRQLRSVSANSVRTSYGSSCERLATPVTPGTPSSPATPLTPGTPKNKVVAKETKEQAGSPRESVKSNRLSLEDRKRLFLNEEKLEKTKVTEHRRKSIPKVDTTAVAAPPTPSVTPATPALPISPVEQPEVNGNTSPTTSNPVVLRKKSFASCNGNPTSKDDPTPELMKVFARRSLKVKDEEVMVTVTQQQPVPIKKMPPTQSVDSDKENQSNSEEKLDKLAATPQTNGGEAGKVISHNHHHHPSSNRNSVADFRNLNNNNNQGSKVTSVQAQAQQQQKVVSYLPPIKVSNSGRNSLNNNNNNNGGVSKPVGERFSLQLKQATPTVTTPSPTTPPATGAGSGATAPSKPIERSATVGEFKGIHQRRAEWEQRAKEALK